MSSMQDIHDLFDWMNENTTSWCMAHNPHVLVGKKPVDYMLDQGPLDWGRPEDLVADSPLYHITAHAKGRILETYASGLLSGLREMRQVVMTIA